MNDRLTFKITLTISLLGILVLFMLPKPVSPLKQISEITEQEIDNSVRIIGQVIKIKDLPGIALLNIKDKTGEITVIIFKEEELKIKQNDFLEIEGKITEYKGEIEIQAERIIK